MSCDKKIPRLRERIIAFGVCLAAAAGLVACGGGGGGGGAAPPPPPPPPPPPGPRFFGNSTAGSGIDYTWGFNQPPLQPRNGPESAVIASTFGGVASGDCDRDGDIDLFITYGDEGPNRLYLNQLVEQGNGLLFVDTADTAGVANSRLPPLSPGNDRHSGPAFADMDGDGDLDLAVGALYGDPVKIYRNDGACTFTDVTDNSPELVNMVAYYTFSASFGDYDLDGDLDMFLSHWGTSDRLYADPGDPLDTRPSDHLWENVSDASGIRFVNISEQSDVAPILWSTHEQVGSTGIPQFYDFTYTGTFARMDDDPWPDLLVVSDFGTSQLLINEADGTFRTLSTTALEDVQQAMGSALGDFDDDGDLDWFATSIMGFGADAANNWGNRFYRNVAELFSGFVVLRDATDELGVADGGWGWAACFLDIDNDADLDIYHTNGWFNAPGAAGLYTDDRSRVFVYNGATYDERASTFGLDDSFSARGAVCADFDEDGDIDIFQTTREIPNSGFLWENRRAAAGNNYIRVKLNGLAPNTEAAGARIYVTIGGQTQMREIMIGSNNYTSQNPAVQHFGIGPATIVDEIRVVWPARIPGPTQPADFIATNLSVNQTFEITQP